MPAARLLPSTRAGGVLCTLALVGACASSSVETASSPSDPTQSDATQSGVGIIAEGCSLVASLGSGAVINGAGSGPVIVTVAHTIKGAHTITVVDADGGEHEARVLAFDKDADLAVLDAAGLDVPALSVAEEPVERIDTDPGSILTWGSDEGIEEVPVEIVKRLRVTIEDIYVDGVVERTALEIAGAVTVGDSGGPVLNEAGDVIGIIYANSRGRGSVGFATDQIELVDLLAAVNGETVENGTCF